MKKILFFLITSILFASCGGNKDQFTIRGSIQGIDTGMIVLQKLDEGNWLKLDSAKLENGKFSFKGKIGLPEMWYLSMQAKQIFIPVFVENAAMVVEIFPDSLDKTSIKGSESQDHYKQYQAQTKALNSKMEEIFKEWKVAKEAHDSIKMKITDSISTELDKEMKNKLIEFAKSNNKSVVSPFLVMRNSWQFELPELEEMVAAFDTSLNGSTYVQVLKRRVDILRKVAIGQQAPDFAMNDSLGRPVTLSSLKGKVLLVDFWASWCGPCRAENPNVVKAYQMFNKKGFDILGVSFDQNREKWIKAIKDDKLTWNQVSDLKGWGNAAGKLYGVNSIPSNILLDKDQMIIGRNLRGDALRKKLEEIFGKK